MELTMDAPKLSPVLLNGDNYLLWSRTTKAILGSKGLLSHLEDEAQLVRSGTAQTAAEKTAEDKWFREDQTTLTILQSLLIPSILNAYSYCESAKDLWKTLFEVYGNTSNLSRVFELKKALTNLSQGDRSFNEHFGEYRALWTELDSLRPSSVDPATLNERREQDLVFGLLLTLNPAYTHLVRDVLRADKLPSLNEVCMKIKKDEGSLNLFGLKEDLIVANKGNFKREDGRAIVCHHCKKPGHTKDKCWILNPHLNPFTKPATRYNSKPRAALGNNSPSSSSSNQAALNAKADTEMVTKTDLENLFKSFMTSKENGKPKTLIVDSGASHHMICNKELINNVEPTIGNVVIASGEKIPVRGLGDLDLFNTKSKALYMPEFTSNLLSVRKATNDLHCEAVFGPNKMYFQDIETGRKLGEGGTSEGLYVLNHSVVNKNGNPSSSGFISSLSTNNALWHARLGHPHTRALEILLPNISFKHDACEACILGKHCRSVFPISSTIYERCFDLIHSDVWTAPCLTRDNHRYFVTFIDEKSKYTWITLLPNKSRVFEAFQKFHSYVINHFNAKIKFFRTDNGGEYTSHEFRNHLSTHGIVHQTSCPNTPQQNGVAERKNRHLMEVSRSMMFHMNVGKEYWGDAVVTATYLINRLPTKCLKDVSPYEVLNKSVPRVEHLRVFGCVCFVHVGENQRNKLQAKSVRCIFVGYSPTQKGYKCFDPTARRMYTSRDVKFLEEKSYYGGKDWEKVKDITRSSSGLSESLRFILQGIQNLGSNEPANACEESQATETAESDHSVNQNEGEPHHQPDHDANSEGEPQAEQNSPCTENRQDQTIPSSDDEIINYEQAIHEQDSDQEDIEEIEAEEEEPENMDIIAQQPIQALRRSTRIPKPSIWKNTRVYYNAKAVAHPIQAVCSLASVPTDHHVFLSQIDQNQIPKTYEEAKDIKEFAEAMKEELNAMARNKTWTECTLPKGKKMVGSRWVFTIKYKSDGEIERYKARLVARGFTQTYGVDYNDTFAPVAKLHTVRVIISLATNLSWDMWQMDVKNAFLQGELTEEVYMKPPPGLDNMKEPGNVLRLNKAIYGLKQSPRAWYHKLSSTLRAHGFKRSESDHSLFTLKSGKGIIVVLIYVDDIIITGNDTGGIQDTKDLLKKSFDIKDLGELKYFLGIEICKVDNGLFLSQRKYTIDLLRDSGKIGSKAAKTPIEENYKDEKETEPFEDIGRYQRLVGKLIYLTITRPDICFAVNQVSQHMTAPTMHHWYMVERILRYLKGGPGQGIWMGKNANTDIVGYCDADWAGDKKDRKSTTGYCTFVGGNLVTWKSKKQKVVSRSSAEAEYRAMANITDELIWLRGLLKDLGVQVQEPITLHCDNQAAIHIASNSVFHERTKHIEVDCHHIREKVEMGIILPTYTKSADQLADIFTKATNGRICKSILPQLGLLDLHKP